MSSRRSIATTSPSNNVSLRELVTRKRRYEKRLSTRKRVFSSGWKSIVLNATCLLTSFLLCFSHFEHLQADADYKLFEFNHWMIGLQKDFLPGIVRHGHSISALMFGLHIIAIKSSKARFSFSDLLAVFVWPALVFLHYEQNHHQDYLITRLALSTLTLVVYTAIVFLPRKLKRRKSLNAFYSAFSVASTPPSQRSNRFNQSQGTMATNLSFDERTNHSNDQRTVDFEDCESIASKYAMSNRLVKQKNPDIRNRINHKNKKVFGEDQAVNSHNGFESMSLRSGKHLGRIGVFSSYAAPSIISSSAVSSSSSAPLLKQFGWREKMREQTPMREVRELIDDLLINSADEDEENECSADEESEQQQKQAEPTEIRQRIRKIPFKMPAKMLTPGALSPSRKRRTDHQGPFASLTYNPAVRKIASSCTVDQSPNLFGIQPKFGTLSFGGSSCSSSLSSSNVNSSSPFRHL